MELRSNAFGSAGEGPVLVCLHGLLGSSRNWNGVARSLAGRFAVKTVDLPDHGRSPWTEEASIKVYADAVATWLDKETAGQVVLVGHSLGGKVAMQVAFQEPDRVGGLVVVDIAPRRYNPHYVGAIDALLSLPLEEIASRREADEWLQARIPDWALRQFLLTNLVRDGDAFRWQPNLTGIRRDLEPLAGELPGPMVPYPGPTLVCYGGRSEFEVPRDLDRFKQPFPTAAFQGFPEAGHNLHIEAGAAFTETLREWVCETVSKRSGF